MTRGPAALALAALLAGCTVAPLPRTQALREQGPRDQKWDVQECREDAEDASGYDSANSPGANLLAKLFFWSTAGAALGGTVTGLPTSVDSQATEGLIAGAGAGAIAGGAHGWMSPRSRFEQAYAQCMEGRGYRILPKTPPTPPADAVPSP
jgi:hypothetical protein